MGKDFWKTVRTIILIVALGAVLWYVLKWFGGVANENAGGMGGSASQYEQKIDGE